jgi:hypothetical protein
VLWGIAQTACLVLLQDPARVIAMVGLVLAGSWVFGGTSRVPPAARWAIGLVTMVATVFVVFAALVVVVALFMGWFGEQALDGEDGEFSVEVVAFDVGPTDEIGHEPEAPALVLHPDDAAALGADLRIKGQTYVSETRYTIGTDLDPTSDVVHCFVGDVVFEGTEQVAVPAGTCVSVDDPPIHTELPS